NASGGEDEADVLDARPLSAGRIRRVEAQQPLKQLRRSLVDRRRIRRILHRFASRRHSSHIPLSETSARNASQREDDGRLCLWISMFIWIEQAKPALKFVQKVVAIVSRSFYD